jgi:uncharacterized protein YkwD
MKRVFVLGVILTLVLTLSLQGPGSTKPLEASVPGVAAAAPSDDARTSGTEYEISVTGTVDYAKAFEVLKLVNSERAKEGLEALRMSADLLDSAKLRAAEISVLFSHNTIGTVLFVLCQLRQPSVLLI